MALLQNSYGVAPVLVLDRFIGTFVEEASLTMSGWQKKGSGMKGRRTVVILKVQVGAGVDQNLGGIKFAKKTAALINGLEPPNGSRSLMFVPAWNMLLQSIQVAGNYGGMNIDLRGLDLGRFWARVL